jgi:YesN/AraC family two-component response regulator
MPISRVLIVDDEPAVRAFVASVLESLGCQPIQAKDAFEALKTVEESAVDLVVTDIIMPGMSGLELVRELQRRSNPTRCLLMSGNAEGMSIGAVPFLAKPFTVASLKAAVHRVMSVPHGTEPGDAAECPAQTEDSNRGFPSASRPDELERDLLELMNAARKAYRAAADHHRELIDAANHTSWKSDPDGAQALHNAATIEREALQEYSRALSNFTEFILNSRLAPNPHPDKRRRQRTPPRG